MSQGALPERRANTGPARRVAEQYVELRQELVALAEQVTRDRDTAEVDEIEMEPTPGQRIPCPWTLVLPLALLLSACPSQDGGPEGPVRLEGGALLVPNRGEGIWTADTRWSASVGLELGHLTADSTQQFGRVDAVVPDSRGNLYILDTQAQEIKVFSPEGEHLRNIGRSGQGPGELGSARGIAITPVDSIWVYDIGNGRFHLFDPSGEFVRDVPRVARGVIASWPGGWDEEVGLLDWSFDRYGYGETRQVNEITYQNLPLRIDIASGEPDTFPTIERKYEVISDRYLRPFVGSVEFSQPVGGAFWFAQTEEYRILKRRWSGDTIMIITREDASPVPVTNRDWIQCCNSIETGTTRQGSRLRLPHPRATSWRRSRSSPGCSRMGSIFL